VPVARLDIAHFRTGLPERRDHRAVSGDQGLIHPAGHEDPFHDPPGPGAVGIDELHHRVEDRSAAVVDADVGEHRVERRSELRVAIPDQELEATSLVVERHRQIASLLGGPRPVGMRRYTQDVQVAIADLECEQDVDPP